MAWALDVTDPARKDMARLSQGDREALGRALDRLVADPTSSDFRKLAGRGDEWRLRVGRLRVILRLENATGTICALRVLPRNWVYRD